MKILALAAAVALAAASFALAVPLPARANVFCPVTIGAVQNLAVLGRADTYGVLLDFDPGNTSSVRMRVDSGTTRYAVDFNGVAPPGDHSRLVHRYFVMPHREQVLTAWVEATGTSPEQRTECPITRPYAAAAPRPTDTALANELDTERHALRDSFSNRTPVVTPLSFGPTQPTSCTQPFAPARAILPVQPDTPPAATAVHAGGTVVVRVDLDETSSVVDAAVVRSSGFAPLDRAALTAAEHSEYRTESFACRPIATSYVFSVTFAPS